MTPTTLGWLVMDTTGRYYFDGTTWRRLFGTLAGRLTMAAFPQAGFHQSRAEADKQAVRLRKLDVACAVARLGLSLTG